MGTPRSPRQPKTAPNSNGGSVSLSIEAERTIGVVGGIRADATATVGIDAFTRNNRATGYIDPDSRSGGLSVGLGSSKKGLGGEIGVDAQFNENGSINSIGGNIAGSILGFGAGIGGSSAGDARASIQGFGIGVEIAKSADGDITLQTCFTIGVIEACTSFSRDKGDPQNTEGTLKLPSIDFTRGNKTPRPTKPNTPTNTSARKKPQPKPQSDTPSPKRNPRPEPPKADKPKTDKKPQLDSKKKTPVGFGKKPISAIKRPASAGTKLQSNPRKKPLIDLKKKPGIDLKKKPLEPRKKPNIDIKKPSIDSKKKPTDLSPINLKKPVITPKPPSPTRPKSSPLPPKTPTPKPAPPPKPTPSPKPPRPLPSPSPSPSPSPNSKPGVGLPPADIIPLFQDHKCYHLVWLNHTHISIEFIWSPDPNKYIRPSVAEDVHGGGVWTNNANRFSTIRATSLAHERTPAFIEFHEPPNVGAFEESRNLQEFTKYKGNWKAWALFNNRLHIVVPGGYRYNENQPWPYQIGHITSTGSYIKDWLAARSYLIFDISVYEIPCRPGGPPPKKVEPPKPKINPPRLPNRPPKIKPMDCCKELKEIHKYLGIPKMKKDKFKVAKAFMVAGGTGNQECENYYEVTQSLFRMLANGLIINPITKPLGNDWQVVNATAWAAQMYEMTAESMSDGNSTQKFEIATIMQLAQLMSTLAETTRKIEYIIDAIGYEPLLDTEEVTIPFTIYEGHKGFAKVEPKKIDITKPKTDNEVEAVLATMLQPSKIPIVSWQFDPNNISISKALRAL